MTSIDPRLLLIDDNLRRYEQDRNVDLLASNAPNVGTGRYVCFEEKVPKGQVLVIGGMAFYAKQRINVGAGNDSPPSESNEMIQPKDGNGWFSFEPQINDAVLKGLLPGIDYAAPRLAGGTLNNNDRQRAPGISQLSLEPRQEAQREWQNQLYRFAVPSDAVFRVIFTILPVASTSPLVANGRYTIGAAALKRVDYAGVFVVGHQMSEQTYSSLYEQSKRERNPIGRM